MKKIIIATLFITLLVSAFAHEYVLLAYKWRVAKGDSLEVHLFVADGFNIQQERGLQPAITKKLELITENGVVNLAASGNSSLPIINIKADFAGLGLFHTERDYARITMATPKFLAYLKEDHIENIIVPNDPEKKFQKERYTRYIKCLVHSGQLKNDTLYKTVINQNFEIILLQNPYLLKVGSLLKAQVFFMGKPLANKIITARNRTGNEAAIAINSRTDAKGICTFQLKRKGDWFLHATHMIVSPDRAEADWESFWTSYSFGIE